MCFYSCITLSTNKITRWVEDGLEPQHELIEEARFGVLKYFHPLQRVQMNMYGYFGPELARQQVEYLIVVRWFVIGPQKVKPSDHAVLQALGHATQWHVSFDRIQFGLKKFNLTQIKLIAF